jgi:hypothetical protein
MGIQPTMYKRFTSDVRTMNAKLFSAQEEMNSLSEKLAADSVEIQSMMVYACAMDAKLSSAKEEMKLATDSVEF